MKTENKNKIIEEILETTDLNDLDWHRFKHCQAQYSEPFKDFETDYMIQFFVSYTTVVAVIIDGQLYELGKYSQTTSKQITQWWGYYDRELLEWQHNSRLQYFTGGARY